MPGPRTKSIQHSLEKYTYPEPNTGCWLWGGPIVGSYGKVHHHWKGYLAHRASYEFHKNVKLTSNIILRHTCDNPLCVNPDHLLEGSQDDNIQDMVSKNRQAKGSKQGQAILKEDQVLTIKQLLKRGKTQASIARTYNVSEYCIHDIKRGKSWSWLV